MRKSNLKCCLCKKEIKGPTHPHTEELLYAKGEYFGNNPYPLCHETDYKSRCCDMCDCMLVIPARMGRNVYSEDLHEQAEVRAFGLGLWRAHLKGRKMLYEMSKNSEEEE